LRRTNRRRKKKKKNKKKKKKLIIMASYPPGRQNPGGQNPAWGRRPTQPFAMAHQPAAGLTQLPPPNSGTWTTGLCGCSRDLHSCKAWSLKLEVDSMSSLSRIDHVILLLLVDDGWVWLFAGCCATCCPCVLMGRIAEIVDEGSTCKLAPMTHPHWSIWASPSMVNPQLLSIYRDQQTFSRLSLTPNCKFPRSACQNFRVGVWDLRAATSTQWLTKELMTLFLCELCMQHVWVQDVCFSGC
jgi:hypothetical protein